MTWLFVIVALAVVAVGFLAVLGLFGDLPAAEPDLRPAVHDGRPAFDVVARGYRMDEVDATLADLQEQIDRLREPG